jgi:hypothetical protein
VEHDDDDEDEAPTTLDDLMAAGTEGGRPGRPPSGLLVVASVLGTVVAVVAIPRLVHWLFPVPWDVLEWLAKVLMWHAGHA